MVIPVNKMLESLVKQARYFKIIKAECHKVTTKVVLNAEKLETFSLKSGTRQRCLLFLLLSYIQGL